MSCELSEALDVLDVGSSEVLEVNPVEPGHIGVSCLLKFSKVELEALGAIDGVVRHDEACIFPESGQIEHNFLWDASNIDTCASDLLVLDHGYLFTVLGRTSGRCYAPATCSYNQVVDLLLWLSGKLSGCIQMRSKTEQSLLAN